MKEEKSYPDIRPCGDRALTIEFGDAIAPDINDRVFDLYHRMLASPPEGLTWMVPSFASLLVEFDPDRTSLRALSEVLLREAEGTADPEERNAAGGMNPEGKAVPSPRRIWEIPCCYSERFAPDLPSVAEHAGLTEEEVVRLHCSADYRIYMLGFLPGFVYLGGLDPRIACPRLPSPRKKIPKGAVGIGGSQTGIYPLESPGGWRLIGSTPVPMYDPSREDPVFCRPGDFIRFVPITTCDYYDIAGDYRRGLWKPASHECGSLGNSDI